MRLMDPFRPAPPSAGLAETRLRVRYAETDRMQVAHHGHYLVWFEVGRTHLMRERGMPYTHLEAQGILLPVTEAACRWLGSARYDDEVAVVTWLAELRSRKVVFGYEVRRGGETLATGTTAHVPTDASGRVVSLPVDIRQRLGSAGAPATGP